MSQPATEAEKEYNLLPDQVRQHVDEGLPDASTVVKLIIGNAMADEKEFAKHAATSAGRIGLKSGQVSELTMIFDVKPGGAERLRRLSQFLGGSLSFAGALGLLHDARITLLEDDTKLLFATTYDGDLDSYLESLAIKIPEMLDYLLADVEGWPGVRTPESKGFLAGVQHGALAWYVAHPELTVAEQTRLLALDENVNNFVEKLN